MRLHKTEEGALCAPSSVLPLSVRLLLLFAGLLGCLLRCFLCCFLGCHINYSPFRCDIENCSVLPQLHEGIVLRKIKVKKKIAFRPIFFVTMQAQVFRMRKFSEEEGERVRRKVARYKFYGAVQIARRSHVAV